ncbi:MAG TPA: alkaline phosphatase family protein [Candidatus Krumholzibacteria bacterium]|nr:alkaline phosphatase family protein [Candidatus Krumholzibacteria bacterium]
MRNRAGRLARATLAAFVISACIARAETSVVVIGIDGMDPGLLAKFIAEGRMPNFARLAAEGSFDSLETSIPPQSPVAWSNFITGMDPGGHGIFDFIHRDPATYTPVFSAADVVEPGRTLSLGDWVLPLSRGGTVLLRGGEAFWQVLDRHDVPCTIVRVPANYPPAETRARSLAGMGTPDLLGSYGTFSLYTNDEAWRGAHASGGRIYSIELLDDRAQATLVGPPNTLRKDRAPLSCPMAIDADPEHDAARITIGGAQTLLFAGEWSDWVPVAFRVAGPFKKLRGMVRLYLRSVTPLQLYVSPLNIDPTAPALPISTPDDYARELAARVGRYYTQGIAEDTKALEAGVFDDAEFVAQTDTLLSERSRMLDAVLDDYEGGFLFFYVSTVDQSCHALWRNADPAHPAHPAGGEFADRFGQLYEEMDAMLGRVRDRIPADATLMVLSDHGFAPYYKKVNLNSWLHQNGYLALIRSDEIGQHPLFNNVFWRRTRAYGAGINGLYVNRAGRESKGIVPAGQVEELLDEISRGLLALRDPETGEQVITTVYRGREVYHGAHAADAPDLVIGYNRGYRGSDDSALGMVTSDVITPNLGKWTGDHCIDHRWVPGILLMNRRAAIDDPSLLDMPVTILAQFGVPAPPAMTGRNVLAETTAASSR